MKCSVALAYYNGGKYIKEQLDSILCQLSKEDEIILSIDGAHDGSMPLLEELAEADSRIRLIEGPGRGVVANFAHAIKHCDGDLIFLSDQDDLWMPDKVKQVKKIFDQHSIMAVLHNAILVDENGKEIPNEKTMFEYRQSRTGLLKNLIKNSYVGCCMAFRKELLPIIDPIPAEMYMHDFWIGMAAEKMGGVGLMKTPLIKYRRHASNVTEMTHGSLAFMVKKRLHIIKCLRTLSKRTAGQNR